MNSRHEQPEKKRIYLLEGIRPSCESYKNLSLFGRSLRYATPFGILVRAGRLSGERVIRDATALHFVDRVDQEDTISKIVFSEDGFRLFPHNRQSVKIPEITNVELQPKLQESLSSLEFLFDDYDLSLQSSELKITLDYLVDFRGEALCLGTTVFHKNGAHRALPPTHPFSQFLAENIKCPELSPNSIFTIVLSKICGLLSVSHTLLNRPRPHWENYRSIGINIPLLLLYSSFHIGVKVHLTMPSKITEFGQISDTPKALFEAIFTDLDGTLIQGDKLIVLTYSFLQKARARGSRLVLVTRNSGNIPLLLDKHGVNSEFFSEIIQLDQWQLKSSFVEKGGFFIDNEFLERREVFGATGAFCVSVDQLDFF